jgi:FAD:protein FMN transferase
VNEHVREVPCFGGRVTVRASGTGATGFAAPAALVLAEALLLRVHARLSCFDAGSELSRLNDDERDEVRAGPLVLRFAAAVAPAGWLSGGLVDATVGSPGGAGRWPLVGLDLPRRSVRRPPGVRMDSGGLAKGLAADLVTERLAGHASYAVECLGDLRVGGTEAQPRRVRVADPFGGEAPVAVLRVARGAVATSGTTRRTGHLIDPRHRRAGRHRDRAGDRACAHRPRGGGARQGRAPGRPRGGGPASAPRRRDRHALGDGGRASPEVVPAEAPEGVTT